MSASNRTEILRVTVKSLDKSYVKFRHSATRRCQIVDLLHRLYPALVWQLTAHSMTVTGDGQKHPWTKRARTSFFVIH